MTMGDVQEPARLRTRWVSLLSEGSMRRLRPLCESDSETMGSGAWQSQSRYPGSPEQAAVSGVMRGLRQSAELCGSGAASECGF